MAANNKFATMLHELKTPKMAIVLVFTVLEWILIALLLLNGVFSHLISRFAAVVGLKPPCVFCSQVDHVFGRRKSYRDLVCDAHAAEVAKLGYCAAHRNLAEASEMCEDCAASARDGGDRTAVAVLSWMKRSEEGEKDLRCSCCDVALESGFYSPYFVLKPSSSWNVLECGEERSEGIIDKDHDDDVDNVLDVEKEVLGGNREEEEEEQGEFILLVEHCDDDDDASVVKKALKDASLEIFQIDTQTFVEEERLIPIELIDSSTQDDVGNLVEKDVADLDVRMISEEEEKASLLLTVEISSNVEEELHASVDCSSDDQFVSSQSNETALPEGVDVQMDASNENFGEFQAYGEDSKAMDAEGNCEISIGSEICDQEQFDLDHCNEPVIPHLASTEDQCSQNTEIIDKEQVEETIPQGVHCLSICPALSEVEEERAPETPTSIEGIHALHKRFLFERRESGSESVDGSVASEMDGSEILTVDHLRVALKAERRALGALYSELEEERSASAIAANQTMAMITRLQEEKAAMQMEALQYQRMMEEQSEYDQEALQLLNELMMKREKEKQELEKELEVYRKKVLAYEAKERRRAAARSKTNSNGRSGTSSASSCADDSDDLSFESHEGDECSYSHNQSNQNTPVDDVLSSVADQETSKHLITLDESLADFEEERLSILEQLKALEEKLFSLDEDDLKSMGHRFSDENGHGFNEDYESSGDDIKVGVVNGFADESNINGKLHHEPRRVATRGKMLLPLFDATISVENEDESSLNEEAVNGSLSSVSKLATDYQKKLAVAEEVDNVYERLQALEADREFLKHCISSLKKGDKGMDLLQEILQHLRDLRSVELRVRNAGDALASL